MNNKDYAVFHKIINEIKFTSFFNDFFTNFFVQNLYHKISSIRIYEKYIHKYVYPAGDGMFINKLPRSETDAASSL